MKKTKPLVLGIDAGGTMTDTILVDQEGNFAVGKAPTTPNYESEGFIESARDATNIWDLDINQTFEELAVVLYSGTGMLNTLLSRTGKRIGLIVTRGMEDAILMGRGLQSWAGYSYEDRLHAVTHAFPEPLVPLSRVRGVTERIDQFGQVVIPAYEHEAISSVEELLEQDIEALCICTMYSHVNPEHEIKIGEAAKKVLAEHNVDIPIYFSHQVRPIIREQSRLNSTLIEAYATARGREQLLGVEAAAKEHGFPHSMQTMLSYGGLADVRYPRLHETMISGPVGGLLGAKHVGELVGADSVIVSDMGGTSFDIGAITRGKVPIEDEPTLARFKLNLPTLAMDTIGAGGGTIVKVDPSTGKVSLGPESAGSVPGPVAMDMGGTEPTIADCDAIMGRLNPDNFLGGKVKLNIEKATQVLKEKVADPLGVDVYEAAEGMVNMLEMEAKSSIESIISTRGVDPGEYHLMAYGGSGPLHMAEYSRGLGFKGILTFPFAAAFSAFGCTTADYLHRHSQSVHIMTGPDSSDKDRVEARRQINEIWSELDKKARSEFVSEGHDADAVVCEPFAMMRFTGQLEDVEVAAPMARLESNEDLDKLTQAFEELYETINRSVSGYGTAGYTIMELGLNARVEKVKPELSRRPLGSKTPDPEASKGKRSMYYNREWQEAQLWEMDMLKPGNVLEGPAIVEHPATTLVIPEGDRVRVDEWTILHYEHGEDTKNSAGNVL
ncbi:N-methylhydantoinase A/oxoprolinase/acetone carboxylase, beta subunit [Lentibacillus persicus]|uniref:N-methylhydantoinase A/oxoprolinase/acetone carboxylase, beta subunit n=1 Tax=Lentibacillus persicus TaxID=640948 RepID=A0A1I1YX53_9BACI|nr:hydantoinase/oxoprolinase family protein [Lentibacillus persicus]SFE24174.1 N-methylhydantoinase A/oxoprolinase/acetone carboxylase, beta subunit [Lentibacillus persicus]